MSKVQITNIMGIGNNNKHFIVIPNALVCNNCFFPATDQVYDQIYIYFL